MEIDRKSLNSLLDMVEKFHEVYDVLLGSTSGGRYNPGFINDTVRRLDTLELAVTTIKKDRQDRIDKQWRVWLVLLPVAAKVIWDIFTKGW